MDVNPVGGYGALAPAQAVQLLFFEAKVMAEFVEYGDLNLLC